MAINMHINEDGVVTFNRARVLDGPFRNFSGGPTYFDPKNTARSFEIELSAEEAEKLKKLGYNIKVYTPRNPSEPSVTHLKIAVRYDCPEKYQPRIWLTKNNGNPELMKEGDLSILDRQETVITRAAIRFKPYDWNRNGVTGRRAELSQMYVTIEEDDFGAEFWNNSSNEELPFV